MSNYDKQMNIELTYSRKHIDDYIREELEANTDAMNIHMNASLVIEGWIIGEYYPSKMARLEQLKGLDIDEIVMQILIGVSYCQTPELFTAITAALASRLHFDDKSEAITTVAELCAIMAIADCFDIGKETKRDSLYITAKIPLNEDLCEYICNSKFLPPMVCKPETITHNYQSTYLTYNDSVILKPTNHHNDPVSLDFLNNQNGIALKFDHKFLNTCLEEPTFELDTPDKKSAWSNQLNESLHFYSVIGDDSFYLENKFDKRGRSYVRGYHITTQGTAYKKAMVEFAKEELIDCLEMYQI